jgi:hypothetical protein
VVVGVAVYFHVHVLVLVQGGVVNPWLLVQELCQLRVQEVRQLAVVVVVVVGVVVYFHVHVLVVVQGGVVNPWLLVQEV